MAYDVQLEQPTVTRHLAVVRLRADARDLPRVVPAACGKVWGVVRAKQVPDAGRHVAVYLDGAINLEVGVEVGSPFVGDGDVVGSTLPVGTAATAKHLGPYGGLGTAHQAIRDWCADRGYALAGPNWEIYGHWEDAWNADPSRIRTDVFYLLDAAAPSGR